MITIPGLLRDAAGRALLTPDEARTIARYVLDLDPRTVEVMHLAIEAEAIGEDGSEDVAVVLLRWIDHWAPVAAAAMTFYVEPTAKRRLELFDAVAATGQPIE